MKQWIRYQSVYSKLNQGLTVLAQHDPGCAKSVVNEATFNNLLSKGYMELKQ